MKRLSLILVIGTLAAVAFSQKEVKLGAKFGDLVNGTSKANVQAQAPAPTLGAQLQPTKMDRQQLNRGVPEPATMAVFGVGLGALLRRRRR